ncbi:MAG: hypothetical protein LBG99_03900 [Propionibacteriaceae bacterium]|jgi:hypothetical protein|nr:hypothetical protein [Propionibacteriaceae bacterium]
MDLIEVQVPEDFLDLIAMIVMVMDPQIGLASGIMILVDPGVIPGLIHPRTTEVHVGTPMRDVPCVKLIVRSGQGWNPWRMSLIFPSFLRMPRCHAG